MKRMFIAQCLTILTLAGCGPSATAPDPAKTAEARRANVSITDPRMPEGFTIYVGETGRVQEFQIAAAGEGIPGRIATFSVLARPNRVRDFYEAQAVARGMDIVGRVNANEVVSVDARQSGEGTPHTFGAMAVKKGQYTNVTLMFDVTP